MENQTNQNLTQEPVPESVQVPIQVEKTKTNWLASIIFLILGIAIGVIGLWGYQKYFSKPTVQPISNSTNQPVSTPDPTTDWKTYTYQTFSIKFPNGWSDTTSKNPVQFLNYTPTQASGRSYDALSDKGKLKVEIYQEDTNNTLREFLTQKKLAKIDLNGDTVWQETETKISGIDAIKVKTSNPGFVYYVKNTSSNTVISIAFGLDFDNYLDLSNQILSTFKFTEVSNSNNSNVGTVSGTLCYPSEEIPAGQIVAKNITTGKLITQNYHGTSAGGKITYSLKLPAGNYHLKLQISPNLIGYYDTCVQSSPYDEGGICRNRSNAILLPVTVASGSEIQNINLCDYYYTPEQESEFNKAF